MAFPKRMRRPAICRPPAYPSRHLVYFVAFAISMLSGCYLYRIRSGLGYFVIHDGWHCDGDLILNNYLRLLHSILTSLLVYEINIVRAIFLL